MKKIMMMISAAYLMMACGDNSKKEVQDAKMMAIDSMKMESKITEAKQEVIDSMKTESKIESAKKFTRDSLKDSRKPTYYAAHKISKSNPDRYVSSNPAIATNLPIVAAPAKKKRKISRPVEGALIGAGVGAISGAIINKSNRGKGAIIGGVIGAGVGAGTGVIIDKKQKKKGN